MRLNTLGQVVVTCMLLFIVWRVLVVKFGTYRLMRWAQEGIGAIDLLFLIALGFIVLLLVAKGWRSKPFDD